MFLLTRNPAGFLSSIDIGTIPSWDLGLEIRPVGYQGGETAFLVVVLSYPLNGQMIRVVLDALDTQSKGDELTHVLTVGLPTGTRSGDKARFAEALKIIANSGMPVKDVDVVISRSAALVDCFWSFRDALWGADQSLNDVGTLGRHDNTVSKYMWVLSNSRNGALFPPTADAAAGMGTAPGAGYSPVMAAPVAAAEPKSDLGPPPGTEGKGVKGKKPAAPEKEGDKALF